jgi:hypothetical protein
MNSKFLLVTIGTWLLLLVLAIFNAGIRNLGYQPVIGDLRAHQLSTIIYMSLILLTTYLIFRFTHVELNDYEPLLMGVIWFLLTITFEFIAGHYVFGNSWEKLLHDYNIYEGRIWILVLIMTLLSPSLAQKLLEI